MTDSLPETEQRPDQAFTDEETDYIRATFSALASAKVIPLKTTLQGYDEPVVVLAAGVGDEEFIAFAILLTNEELAGLVNTPEGAERVEHPEEPEPVE